MIGELNNMNWVHVPYKSLPQQGMGDFLSGRIQLLITGFPAVANSMKTGKLRVLAVASPVRSALNPEAPTFKESGLEGVEIDVWQAVMVPSGTPAPVIERLNAEFNRILKLPRVRERLAPQGIDAVGGSAAEFTALLGERPPQTVLHQCGSGVTACHNLLAMEVAGLSGSRLFPGSWSEWVSERKRPVVVGA